VKVGYVVGTEILSDEGWINIKEVTQRTKLLALEIATSEIKEITPDAVFRQPSTALTVKYHSGHVSLQLPSRHPALAIIGRDARLQLITANTILDRPFKLPTANLPKRPVSKPIRIRGAEVTLTKYNDILTAIVVPDHALYIRMDDKTAYWCGAVQTKEGLVEQPA
jgi:hypothetical protein